MSDDYENGYGKPPKKHQFKPGKSGNPKGRPAKKGAPEIDIEAILNREMKVMHNGKKIKMSPREIALRKILKKALNSKDLQSIKYLLDQFERFGVLEIPEASQGGVLTLPNTMPFSMAFLIAEQFGVPPWTEKELSAGRADYLATRTEEKRIIDEQIGYKDL